MKHFLDAVAFSKSGFGTITYRAGKLKICTPVPDSNVLWMPLFCYRCWWVHGQRAKLLQKRLLSQLTWQFRMRVSRRIRGKRYQVQPYQMDTLHHTQAPVEGLEERCLGHHPFGAWCRCCCHSSDNHCSVSDAEENVQKMLPVKG